jgi:nicotinate phosphoribosyltransferase
MKFSKGSGKATLPGELQVYRFADHDIVALAEEAAPSGGQPLLQAVWRGRAPSRELPPLDDSRRYVKDQIESLPPPIRALDPAAPPWKLVASDGLCARIEELVKEAGL